MTKGDVKHLAAQARVRAQNEARDAARKARKHKQLVRKNKNRSK